jgi:hypothetical protein
MSRHREVLHETGQVAKADVDDLDAFVLRQLDDFGSGAILHGSSLVRAKARQLKSWSVKFGACTFRHHCSTVNAV